MSDVADLSKFRAEHVEVPRPDKLVITFRGNVLSVDQSIASSGWADMLFTDDEIIVRDTGLITTKPDAEDMNDTFERGVLLVRGLRTIFRGRLGLIVHEMPTVQHARMKSRNREAGPVAALAVRCAADVEGVNVRMLNAQHVRVTLGLPAKASKNDTREVVKKYLPGIEQRRDLRLNEHTYDAMAQGIVAAYEAGL